MKIIILSITQYKEKDAIITALNENELISLSVRSLFSEKSKLKALNVPLTIADVDLDEGKYKYPYIISYSKLTSPMLGNPTLEFMTALNIIAEATKRMLPDEDKHYMFTSLESAIKALKSNKDPYLVALSYLNNVLKVSGYEFEVNKCVNCGTKKGIVNFSFEDGGFLCKECAEENSSNDISVRQMQLLRNVYITQDFLNLDKIEYYPEDLKILLNRYFVYIYDNFGISLNSFKTL